MGTTRRLISAEVAIMITSVTADISTGGIADATDTMTTMVTTIIRPVKVVNDMIPQTHVLYNSSLSRAQTTLRS